MRANYRTSEGNWGTISYPYILIHENEGDGFTICGYTSEVAIQTGQAMAAIADVLEYQVSDENED